MGLVIFKNSYVYIQDKIQKKKRRIGYTIVLIINHSLCKHYELLSVYHNNKDAFDTMITLYGRTPEDGVVHCKHCGEYLCNELFLV